MFSALPANSGKVGQNRERPHRRQALGRPWPHGLTSSERPAHSSGERLEGLRRHPYGLSVGPDPYPDHRRLGGQHGPTGDAAPVPVDGLLDGHARSPEFGHPGLDVELVPHHDLGLVLDGEAHDVHPQAHREDVGVSESSVGQRLPACVLEKIEVRGMVHMPKGVELVGACDDAGLEGAQLELLCSWRGES